MRTINYLHFSFSKKITLTGFNNGEAIEKIYDKVAKEQGIEKISQIQMPLVIPTVDIMNPKEYIFTNNIPINAEDKSKYIKDITVGKAVRASSSFPAVFMPCRIKDYAFMDGGVLDNVPVQEVRNQGAERVLAVKFDADQIEKDSNIMDIAMKTIDIMGSKISEEGLKTSDYILNVYTQKADGMHFFKYIGIELEDLYHVAELQIKQLYDLDLYLSKLRKKDFEVTM
jgi:NTE family protein